MIVTPHPFPRAPYAADPAASRGRRIAEPRSATRTDFQRDRDRIIHSTAFRRLAQKTQVFLPEAGDHFRTRLTHTIEVAQIARTVARALRLDEDLTEALALAHDLGHTPFGHTGEAALDAATARFGGFDHNAQTLRVVTLLEKRYPAFDGLNLTWDTLDGLANRNADAGRRAGCRSAWHRLGLPCFGTADRWTADLDRFPQPSAEAQVAAVADDVAYNAHDIEDGLAAGLFGLADLDGVPLLDRVRGAAPPGADDALVVRFIARELVGLFVEDVIAESRSRIAAARPDGADAVRASAVALVGLSPPMQAASDGLKAFLFTRLYRHPRLTATRRLAHGIVRDLAARFLDDPALLPPTWQPGPEADEAARARRVSDYVAGMTDRLAVSEHRRLFDHTPDLS